MKNKDSRSLIVAAAMALVAMSAPLHAAQTDSAIEASAKQTYVFKAYLKGDDVKVQSKDGVVTLTGTVSEDAKKALAEDTVAALPDVKRVENKLGVKGGTVRSVQPTPPSGLRLVGVVTLTGTAANDDEKALATKRLGDVNGVQSLKNEMTDK
ncbi:MAG: BON domain-containing protein [Proteobacteria bacterium]|nr:BON domain-containing protein [Pseudomonadota bacterium]